MSASFLYHTNQIQDVQVEKEEYHADKIIFKVVFVPKQPLCPCCCFKDNISKGTKLRKLRMAPLGNKMTFLIVKLHRFKCINGLVIISSIRSPMEKPKESITKSKQ